MKNCLVIVIPQWAQLCYRLLQEFLGRQHPGLFLHELEAWLPSPS